MSSTDQAAAARPEDVVRRVWPARDFTLEPLGGGITNRNFVVRVESEAFVLRIGGKDTHLLGIDRHAEQAAARMAADAGVGPEVVAFVEPEGYLVTRFVEGTPITPERMRESEVIGRVAAALRDIHGASALPGRFDAHRVVDDYLETALRHGVSPPATGSASSTGSTPAWATGSSTWRTSRPTTNSRSLTLKPVDSPLVAVPSYRLPPGRVSGWNDSAFAVPEAYVRAARRAGLRPVILTQQDPEPAEDVLAPFDALLLLGGGDVEPSRYDAAPHPEEYGIDPERDEMEISLVHAAAKLGVPTLAVCRGAQVLNVAFGGTLLQHLPEMTGLVDHGRPGGGGPSTHEVKVAPGSRLAAATGFEVLACSSHHHQGIDRVGEGLQPVGWAEDGLVEALEHEEGWLVAVQWHPEDTAAEDPSQQSLFDALAERAGDYRAQSRSK